MNDSLTLSTPATTGEHESTTEEIREELMKLLKEASMGYIAESL